MLPALLQRTLPSGSLLPSSPGPLLPWEWTTDLPGFAYDGLELSLDAA